MENAIHEWKYDLEMLKNFRGVHRTRRLGKPRTARRHLAGMVVRHRTARAAGEVVTGGENGPSYSPSPTGMEPASSSALSAPSFDAEMILRAAGTLSQVFHSRTPCTTPLSR